MRWYIPSSSGDIRVEDRGAMCELITFDPTEHEWLRLEKFAAVARERKWLDPTVGFQRTGEQRIPLLATLAEVVPHLIEEVVPSAARLSVVGLAGGGIFAIPESDGSAAFDAKRNSFATPIAKAIAGVTVKRPTPCCPRPIAGPDIRASEVLQAFSTPRQWRDWNARGYLIAHGRYTGHAYRIAHRHTNLAASQGRVTWDMDNEVAIHCYDWTVPPAEEVLAIKLIMEHAEDWLRNEATVPAGGRDVYKNPWGDITDGVLDTALLTTVGLFGRVLEGGA
jgi:hypothetical protein